MKPVDLTLLSMRADVGEACECLAAIPTDWIRSIIAELYKSRTGVDKQPGCPHVFCSTCARELLAEYDFESATPKPQKDKHEVTLQALQNLGHDVTCGACMSVAFTGATEHPHTCKTLFKE